MKIPSPVLRPRYLLNLIGHGVESGYHLPPSSNMMRGRTCSPLDHGGDGFPLWLSPQTIITCTCHLLHLFSKLVVELAREAQCGDLYFRFCVTYIDALGNLWACSGAIPLLIWWTLYCLSLLLIDWLSSFDPSKMIPLQILYINEDSYSYWLISKSNWIQSLLCFSLYYLFSSFLGEQESLCSNTSNSKPCLIDHQSLGYIQTIDTTKYVFLQIGIMNCLYMINIVDF